MGLVLESNQDALRLLWHVLAWGSGSKLRLNRRRLDGISKDPAAALRHAARLSRTDPEAAYQHLAHGADTHLPYLGPAFFTKYLYFAGAGTCDRPSVILDSRVAHALSSRCGWASLSSGGNWPALTYQGYCALLALGTRRERTKRSPGLCGRDRTVALRRRRAAGAQVALRKVRSWRSATAVPCDMKAVHRRRRIPASANRAQSS